MLKVAIFFVINPSFQLVALYRLYSLLYKIRILMPISYIIYYFTRIFYTSDIHPASKIGKNVSFRHHFGIVIGKNVSIGNNCIIYNDVSIGQKNVSDSKMPILKDNIVVYKGAVICGGGIVASNTVIGANKIMVL